MSANFGGSRFVQPPLTRTVVYKAKGGIVISVGDLMYYDSGMAMPSLYRKRSPLAL